MLPCSHFFRCANVSARVTTLLNPKKSHGAGERSEIKNKSLAFSYMGCFITLVIGARACSGKPWVKKFGYLCIQEFWFGENRPYVRSPIYVSGCEMFYLLA